MHDVPVTRLAHYSACGCPLAMTSGSSVSGQRPAATLGCKNVSPLMACLFAEIAHGATKLTRTQVAPIVEALYAKYEDKITFEEAPKGQPFEELYDGDSLTPTSAYQAVYDEVKSKLVRPGVPLT